MSIDSLPSPLGLWQALVLCNPSQQFSLFPRTLQKGWRSGNTEIVGNPLELAVAGSASPAHFFPHTACKTSAASCESVNPGENQPSLVYSHCYNHWVLQTKRDPIPQLNASCSFVLSFLLSTMAAEMGMSCRADLRAGGATTSTAEMGHRGGWNVSLHTLEQTS